MFYRKHYFLSRYGRKNFQTTQGPWRLVLRTAVWTWKSPAAVPPSVLEVRVRRERGEEPGERVRTLPGLSRQMAEGLPEGRGGSAAALGAWAPTIQLAWLCRSGVRMVLQRAHPGKILRIHMEEVLPRWYVWVVPRAASAAPRSIPRGL